VKFRAENVELRNRIAELSTAGFDEEDFTVGSLSAVARLAEEAETYSARIEIEKRKISEAERKLKDAELAIKNKKDFLAQYAPDTSLRKQVCGIHNPSRFWVNILACKLQVELTHTYNTHNRSKS